MQLGLIVPILAFALPARAGVELITFAYPFHAHELAGVVVDQIGAPVPGVVVEECAAKLISLPTWNSAGKQLPDQLDTDCDRESKHILGTTITDANGRFAFPHQKAGTTHYLYLHYKGMNPMKVIVKIRWYARRTLRIRMQVAT
jgi:hypothetical protein